jgi:ABC-2 type transport system ATP-binding protein
MVRPPVVIQAVHRGYRSGPPWRRQSRSVLRGVHLALANGEIATLRGDNGAGKTTLLRLIAGLLTPDAGDVHVFGDPPHRSAAVRARMGFATGDERSLYQRLTGRQNLEFFGTLHGLSANTVAARLEELSADFDLGDVLDRRVDQCSAGMKARLGLARALLHAPSVLLLDEPTKSLDPHHAAGVREALRRRAGHGLIVLAATHDRRESAQLEARELLLQDGQLTEADTTPEREGQPQ